MLKTVIFDFSVIKPHFSRRLSRLFFSAVSRLSRIFRGRLAGVAEIAAGGRLSRRPGGLATGVNFSEILGGQTKILGEMVVKSDEYMGVSQLLKSTCPGCLPKSTPMVTATEWGEIRLLSLFA